MGLVFIADALRLALKSLSERRVRAILTIVGIAIGPLALVMMSSVVKGYSDYVTSQIESLGQNLIVVRPSEAGFKLSDDDLNFIRSLEGVKRAEPFYLTQAKVKVGTEEEDVTVYATDINMVFEAISGIKILYGSIPSSTETTKAVIGYDVAFDDNGDEVYYVGDALSFTIFMPKSGGGVKVKRVTVLISAILDKFGGAFFLTPDKSIFLNVDAGSKLLDMDEWTGILVLAKSSSDVPKVVNEIREAYHNNVEVISFQGIARIISSVTGAMDFITFSTSLAAFAVAIAGVAATMITSVIERVREIGVMKALGFTDLQVLILILTEGLVMSLIGGGVGIALGVLGANVLASKGFVIKGVTTAIVIKAPPAITPELILKTLGIAISVGLLGSLFPAYKAAKIPPAVALRYE